MVSAILTFFSILICLLLFPVSWIFCLTVVSEYERTIVFRLGKVRRGGPRGPGIVWTLPCLDTAVVVDLRTGVYDIPSQDVLTKDSISVCVNAVVFWRVVDPLLAVCGDGDYMASTHYKSQTVVRHSVQHSSTQQRSQTLRSSHGTECPLTGLLGALS